MARWYKNGVMFGSFGRQASDEELDNISSSLGLTGGGSPGGSLLDFVGNLVLGDDFGSLSTSLKSWLDSQTGAALTGSQEAMNAFNSSEAQKGRDFSASQAELAYQRQVDFYNQYQSLPAQVAQMREAGLNPALMYGNSANVSNSAPTSQATSSPVASGSAASSSPAALVQFIMQMAGIKAQIDNIKADTDNKKADTGLKSVQVTATEAEIAWRKKDIEVLENEIRVGDSIIEVNASNYLLNVAKTAVERLEAKQIEEMLPLIKEYTSAQTDSERSDAALKVAQAIGVKVHSDVESKQYVLNEKVADRQFGLSVVDTTVDSIETAVTTGAVVLDIVGEVFGVESLSTRFDDVTTVRDKSGNIVRTVEKRGTNSKNGKKSRKRRRR